MFLASWQKNDKSISQSISVRNINAKASIKKLKTNKRALRNTIIIQPTHQEVTYRKLHTEISIFCHSALCSKGEDQK